MFIYFFSSSPQLVKVKSIKERKEMSVLKVRATVTGVRVTVVTLLEVLLLCPRLCSESFVCIRSCNSYSNSARQA